MNESLFEQHQNHMRRIANAIIELCLASEAEHEFMIEAERAHKDLSDLHSGIHAGVNPELLNSPTCKPAHWIGEMVKHGYVTPDDVPDKYREAWGLNNMEVIQRQPG